MDLSIEPLIYIGIFVGIMMLVEGVYLMVFGKSISLNSRVNRRLDMLNKGTNREDVLAKLRKELDQHTGSRTIPLYSLIATKAQKANIAFTPQQLILVMIGILILAGCVMETTPNIVILSPILLPLAREIGMEDVHFCIMMVTALGVGFITPPLGLNLFVVSGLTGTSVLKIASRASPYVLSMFLVVLMLAFIPELSLWALP